MSLSIQPDSVAQVSSTSLAQEWKMQEGSHEEALSLTPGHLNAGPSEGRGESLSLQQPLGSGAETLAF